MRCPFRVAAFDQPNTCDKECALLIKDTDGYMNCALVVIATKAPNLFAVNHMKEEDDV